MQTNRNESMASRLNMIWNFIGHYKYLIVIVVGVALVGVLDENSFVKRVQYELQISDLKAEIQKYDERNMEDSRRLKELSRNHKAVERIAREQYFMKTDDEDIFVLSDDLPEVPKTEENETTE